MLHPDLRARVGARQPALWRRLGGHKRHLASRPQRRHLGDAQADGTNRPRVHRNREADKQVNRRASFGVEQRSQPLKDCSDEQLLAELDHRNIRLHERVTESLVHQRYRFGRVLGQGSSAMVYEARHKRTGVEVAVKVIKKDDDMNDDESMATELEILKVRPSECPPPLAPH